MPGPNLSNRPKFLIAEVSPAQAEQLKFLLEGNNYHVIHTSNIRYDALLKRTDYFFNKNHDIQQMLDSISNLAANQKEK